jgi:hypothetical protein
MSLLENLRKQKNEWDFDPSRPARMLTGDTTKAQEVKEKKPEPKPAETVQPEEIPADKALDSFEPPKEAPSVETQLVNENINIAKQQGVPRSNGGLGPREPQFRAIIKAPHYPNREQANTLLKNAEILKKGLTGDQLEYYNTQLEATRMQTEELFTRLQQSKDLQLEKKERIDLALSIAQAVEHLGHSFTRLFAANYGLKKGVDLSGLKFDKYDWATTQSRYDKRFDRIIDSIDKKQAQALTAGKEQITALQESKEKTESEMREEALAKEKMATTLTAADSAAASRQAIAQARLDDAALDRESRERMKAAELASKAMLQSVSMKQKAARSAAEKSAADADAKLAVYDYIKAQLPQEGDVDPDDLSYIIKTVRTSAAKAGVDLAPLAEINEENQGWWMFGNSAEAVRTAIDAETKKLLGLSEGGQNETAAPSPDFDVEFSQEDIDAM